MAGGNDDRGIANALALVNLQGAAGGVAVAVNPPLTDNPYPPASHFATNYGGALHLSDFKKKMKLVFKFNDEVGSIFACAPTAIPLKMFIEDLYLQYLHFFVTNPMQCTNANTLNEGLFDANQNYNAFKHFIVFPNLIHNGHYGFPASLAPKVPAAKNWLKFYAN
jgi:hypothetical protein